MTQLDDVITALQTIADQYAAASVAPLGTNPETGAPIYRNAESRYILAARAMAFNEAIAVVHAIARENPQER